MSNSFKSVEDILKEYDQEWSIKHTLKDHHLYYAHTSSKKGEAVETLSEHLSLVQAYFSKLVDIHQLDIVINGLILCYLSKLGHNSDALANFIKRVFVHSICYHDHGKVNENFQASDSKMNNPNFKGKETENGIGTQHSTLSAFIFLCHEINETYQLNLSVKEKNIAVSNCILFSYDIYKHHGKYFDNDFLEKIKAENKKSELLSPYLSLFSNPEPERLKEIGQTLSKLKKVLLKISFKDFAQSFPLYQLLRLNFSLLTASDYLATNEYMNKDKTDNFGVLNQKRIRELYIRVTTNEWVDEKKGKRNFNKKTFDELETLSLEEKPTSKSNANLNLLRQQMATEAIRNIWKNTSKRIFYLEAPTGGGKTNISMLVVLELLKANSELNKVFYVFPFTTLIDQTFKSIKQSLGLNEDEIVALHSKASFLKEDKKSSEDDRYGKAKKNYIDRLFVNYPFCLLSHIRFFEILKTNEKEQNYILHRLANSIVVIDELQTYPPQHWDKVMYFIQQYADAYNIRFVLMSATLPKIDNLIEDVGANNVVHLLSNAREDYFLNVNFKDRVRFDFSLIEQNIEHIPLVKKVLCESKQFAKRDGGQFKPKGSVFTIVEFIFKKSATRFYDEMNNRNRFFDKIFVLSGTILEHRRKYIINFLKRKENRTKRVLLITTQVVEAGVDIDMDLGFKDTSLIDSDEQLAGRINRNLNKDDCKLFLFNLNHESVIYGKDLRYEMMKELTTKEHKQILESKDFDLLYNKVINFKKKRNSDSNFHGFEDYKNYVENIKFRSITEKFKLIDQDCLSCFIPLDIPIEVEGEIKGEKENIFSKNDLLFLKNLNILPDGNNKISGQKVFRLYMDAIYSKKSFLDKKIQLKQIQSILSKFTFSLFASREVEEKITHFSDMEKSDLGYYYIDRWADFYDEWSGINEDAFIDIEKVQFL